MTNKQLAEDLITQSMWLERFKGDAPEILIERIEKASEAIANAIKSIDIDTQKGFKQLDKVIKEQFQFIYNDLDTLIIKDMNDITETTYNATNNLMNSILIANSIEPRPAFKDIKKSVQEKLLNFNRPILGSTLPQRKNKLVSNSAILREKIVNAYRSDSTLTTAQKQVRAIEQKDLFIANLKRHQIDSLVSTALKSAIEESRAEVFEANKDIATGWRDYSVLDISTTDQCRTLDTKFYPIEKYPKFTDPQYPPPSHFNCRRMRLLETKFDANVEVDRAFTETDQKTVNHRDGTTSTKKKIKDIKFYDAKLSFNELFSKRSKSFQREYLGEKRYNLYKKYGDKVLTEMYSLSRNKRLTLEELNKKLS